MKGLLAELQTLLYGYNYQVFLRAYHVPFASGKPAEWYVAQALGPAAEVGGVIPASGAQIAQEIEESLRYAGDEGSGPKPKALASSRFEELLEALHGELARAIKGAELLAKVWLREGHPDYPVFWDFAFVIAGPAGGLVFIGSSSD